MIPIAYNVRSLLARRSTTLAAALGIALVVFVFAAALMLSNGLEQTLNASGSADNAIILRKGSQAEMSSGIEDSAVNILRAAPEAQPDGTGTLSTAEVVVLVTGRRANDPAGVANVIVRGIRQESLKLRDSFKVTTGRPFTPGSNEVVVGRGLVGRIAGLGLDQDFALKTNRPVRVVGVFEAAGSSFESEIWGDLDTIRAIFGRVGTVSSVTLRLRDRNGLDALKTRVESDPRLGLEVRRESTYYQELSQNLSIFITSLGTMIAIFFSVGAMIGAMITMYAQVAQRSREVGTLRAIGFQRGAILSSFLLEAVLLSLAGGSVGALGAIAMSAVEFSTVSFATFSEVVFGFRATPGIILGALGFASAMGLIGGLFPAVRAAKVSPVEAMRA